MTNWDGSVHVRIDGYYRAQPSGTYLRTLTPVRALDTATGVGGGAFGAQHTRDVKVAGVGAVPASAKAVLVNLSVSDATAGSFLQIFPTGETRPLTWDLCFGAARPTGNQTVLKVGANGQVSVTNWDGNVHARIDVIGWFE